LAVQIADPWGEPQAEQFVGAEDHLSSYVDSWLPGASEMAGL
jgi:hypothetical protein